MSETKKPNIFQRLNEVRKKATYIQKRPKVSGMKFRAIAHADLIRKVRALFVEHGILWFPVETEVLHREHMRVPKSDGGERSIFWTQYKFVFRYQNVDDAEDFMDIPAIADGMDDSDKGSGKASTYADKTALIRSLNLETGEDPDFDVVDIDPDIEPERAERIEKIKKLAAEIVPDDPDSLINSILTKTGEKFGRRIASLLAIPIPLLDQTITKLETQISNNGKTDEERISPHPQRYLDEQAAIVADASDPPSRGRKRKTFKMELPDQRLQTLVLPVIDMGLNDLEARAAVVEWMGSDGHTKLSLAEDDTFETLRKSSMELTADDWRGWIPNQQRVEA